jgi:hypothetical protein
VYVDAPVSHLRIPAAVRGCPPLIGSYGIDPTLSAVTSMVFLTSLLDSAGLRLVVIMSGAP